MEKIKELNEEIRKCKKCTLWETRKNVVLGEGNLHAKLILVAQAPGKNEDREGRMFIGPSGNKLDRLLDSVGVGREEIYMTNLVKCMLPKYRKPKWNEIQACSQYLDKEIELIDPEVIATLGYYPTKYFFGKCNIRIPKSGFSKVYGNLFLAETKKVLSLQHPAALLHDESVEEEMLIHYKKLRTLMVDCKWFPVCPMKRFYEKGKLAKKWIRLYCKGDWKSCIRYQMVEKGESHPDWMLPDGSLDQRLR